MSTSTIMSAWYLPLTHILLFACIALLVLVLIRVGRIHGQVQLSDSQIKAVVQEAADAASESLTKTNAISALPWITRACSLIESLYRFGADDVTLERATGVLVNRMLDRMRTHRDAILADLSSSPPEECKYNHEKSAPDAVISAAAAAAATASVAATGTPPMGVAEVTGGGFPRV